MLGKGVEISLIFRRILGPFILGWAPNHFVLGAQLAPGEKRLVCIPAKGGHVFLTNPNDSAFPCFLFIFFGRKQRKRHGKI